MRQINIEKFYQKHNAFISIASNYLEDSNISFLFKSCRLRPYASLLGPLTFPATLDRWWVDEFGNSFRILKNKRTRIVLNDLGIDRSQVIGTDLYERVNLADLSRISKLAYICVAKDDYVGNDVFIVSFLGNDGFFRTRIFYDGNWANGISTLYLGIHVLNEVIENRDVKYFLPLTKKSIAPRLPLVEISQWITHWPPHVNFVDTLSRKSKILVQQLFNFKENE